jgi:hypothetical protein
MDKTTFKQEISGVKMPTHEISVPIDYSQDLGDNLDMLMNRLLDKYPQLSD